MEQVTEGVWNRRTLKAPHRAADKRERIRRMFSAIADRYDLLNHLLSLNRDRVWRKESVIEAGPEPGGRILDLCCGTGDLALEFSRSLGGKGDIYGVDFTLEMLALARNKSGQGEGGQRNARCNLFNIKWICADAEKLPFSREEFDRVSCAFGIRNLQDIRGGLREMHRVLKGGGKVVLVEFALPDNRIISKLYECYFRLVLPWIGGMIAKDHNGAYQYLPSSVKTFYDAGQIKTLLEQANFRSVQIKRLCLGAVLILSARK